MKSIIFATLGLALAATAGAAQATPAQDADAALNRLFQGFGAPGSYRDVPPDARQSVDQLHAAMTAMGTPDFPVDGAVTFMTVCVPLADLAGDYLRAGVGPLLAADPTGQSPALTAKQAANAETYQDEIVMLMADGVKCSALHAPWLEKTWEGVPAAQRTPAQIHNMQKVGEGYAMALSGLAGAAQAPDTRPTNRKLAIDTVAAHGDAIVTLLPLDRRRRLKAELDSDAPDLAKAWPAQYAALGASLARTDCNQLCSLGQ